MSHEFNCEMDLHMAMMESGLTEDQARIILKIFDVRLDWFHQWLMGEFDGDNVRIFMTWDDRASVKQIHVYRSSKTGDRRILIGRWTGSVGPKFLEFFKRIVGLDGPRGLSLGDEA